MGYTKNGRDESRGEAENLKKERWRKLVTVRFRAGGMRDEDLDANRFAIPQSLGVRRGYRVSSILSILIQVKNKKLRG